MISIRWSRETQTDFAAIDDYYHGLNPAFASRVAAEAVQAARFLAESLEAGRLVTPRTRKWRVGKTPYLLFYRLDGKILRVLRVVHAARDWKDLVE